MAKEFLTGIEVAGNVALDGFLSLRNEGQQAIISFDAGLPEPTLIIDAGPDLLLTANSYRFDIFAGLSVAGSATIDGTLTVKGNKLSFDDIDSGEEGSIAYDGDMDIMYFNVGATTSFVVSEASASFVGSLSIGSSLDISTSASAQKFIVKTGTNRGIVADASNSVLRIVGDMVDTLGAQVALYGSATSGFANQGRLIIGTSAILQWDPSGVSVTGNLDVDTDILASELILDGGVPSIGNPMLTFIAKSGSNYTIYSDSTGAGSDNSRLWLDTPAGGEVVIGPRSGGVRLNQIRLRADNVVVDASPYGGSTGYPVAYSRTGTFTPTLSSSGTNPTVTYSSRGGSYTRLGNVVYFSFRLTVLSVSGGSGVAQIGGLPFNCVNDNNYRSTLPVMHANVTYPVGRTNLVGLMVGGSNMFQMFGSGSAAGYTAIAIGNIGSNAEFWAAGFYVTSDS